MKQRIITAAVLLCIFIPTLFLSGTFVFTVIMSVLSAVSCFEMLRCVGVIRKFQISVPALVFSALIPAISRIGSVGSYGSFLALAMIFLMLLLLMNTLFHKDITFSQTSLAFFSAFYFAAAFASIIKLRDIPDVGRFAYLLIFIGAWITDTCAYFGGMLLGKHKLAPTLSPKKTVEGSICGVVGCMIAYVIYGVILSVFFRISTNYYILLPTAAVISVISQLGDLAMSAVKRNYNIKDYGNLFPGHGGVLDRFDSILAVSPFLLMLFANPGIVKIFG